MLIVRVFFNITNMVDKIKEVVFTSQSYSSNGFDENYEFENGKEREFKEWTDVESETYIVRHNNEDYIGTFLINIDDANLPFDLEGKTIQEVLDFDIKQYGLLDDDGDIIEELFICFNGCNVNSLGYELYLEGFDINELKISFMMPYDDNISLANTINKDIEQPQRAISNYLIRESHETTITQKEFYQMVINSAQHELNLLD